MRLPLDCKAWYYEGFLEHAECKALWNAIETSFDLSPIAIETPDRGLVQLPHGRFNFADEWIVASKMAEPWGQRKAWIVEIRPVKAKVEALTGRIFDVCVGYYYQDGTVGFPYHYDIPCFDDPSILAAVSLGHERVFSFRRVDDHSDSYDLPTTDGSLVVMGEHCRERYEHGLLADESVTEPRLVLVFMNSFGDRPGAACDG
jgi:hypothetical protein